MPDQTQSLLSESFIYRQLTEDELTRFADDGYLLYGPILTDRGLQAIRDECMVAWNAEKGPFDANGTWLQNALLKNIHHHGSLVRQYYFSGPLVDVATQVTGPNIKAATSQLTFKMRGNNQSFAWQTTGCYRAS